jgi:hypothetical protein
VCTITFSPERDPHARTPPPLTHRTDPRLWFVKNPTNYVCYAEERDPSLHRTVDSRSPGDGESLTDYWSFDPVVVR